MIRPTIALINIWVMVQILICQWLPDKESFCLSNSNILLHKKCHLLHIRRFWCSAEQSTRKWWDRIDISHNINKLTSLSLLRKNNSPSEHGPLLPISKHLNDMRSTISFLSFGSLAHCHIRFSRGSSHSSDITPLNTELHSHWQVVHIILKTDIKPSDWSKVGLIWEK